jgi:hypothetical protein
MPVKTKTIPVKAANLIFFSVLVLLLVYFFRKVDLGLGYHMHQPFFSNRLSFLTYYLTYPGGISDYIGIFLFQFYGKGITAVLLVLFQLAIWFFLFFLLVKKYIPAAFLPLVLGLSAIPLITGHGSYQFTPEISVAFILALFFALVYLRFGSRNVIGYLLYILLAVLVFYTTDSIGLSVFLACTVPFQLAQKRYITFILSVAAIFILPFVWYQFNMHYTSLWEAYRGHFITGSWQLVPVLVNSTSLIILVILIVSLFTPYSLFRENTINGLVIMNFIILLPFLFFVSFKLTYNPVYKKILQIDRLAYEKRWDEILNTADINLVQRKPVLMQVNRALYHKGILLDYLFFYPQYFRQDALIIQSPTGSSIAVPLSEIYYDMGFINEARHWSNEALTVLGQQPRILQQLTDTYIISGQYGAAEKYLNILESSVITRSWAESRRQYLNCDECVKKDSLMGRLRRMNPSTDFFAAIENPYENLSHLISDSIPNPMAFEYFIAFLLLSNKPGAILTYLPEFKKLGYSRLPRSCQEAILLDQANKGIPTFSMPGYSIDETIQSNFNNFSAMLFGKYKGNLAAAKSSLSKFSQTYWYYYLYSRPLKSSIKNKGSYSEKY